MVSFCCKYFMWISFAKSSLHLDSFYDSQVCLVVVRFGGILCFVISTISRPGFAPDFWSGCFCVWGSVLFFHTILYPILCGDQKFLWC